MPKFDSVRSRRKSSGEIELHIGGSLCASQRGAKDFQADFSLPQSGPKAGLRGAGSGRLRVVRKVKVIGSAHIPKCIHQNDSGEPRAVLGGGFHFGLILLVNFRAQQLRGFFEFLNAASQICSTWCRGDGRGAGGRC